MEQRLLASTVPRALTLVASSMLVLAAAPAAQAVCSASAKTWECWQGSFTPSTLGSNPYRDLKVKVEFCPGAPCTDPANPANPSTYAFWDGGNQLKMRMAFPSAGVWYWKARCEAGCSFTQSGQTASIAAYSGTNPLYSKGGLQISANGRFIKHAIPGGGGAEQPLVWVGDTTWSGPLRSSATQWTNYLNYRVNQGFSVLQVSLPKTASQQPSYTINSTVQYAFNTQPCGSTTPEPNAAPLPRNQSCWNPPFWQAFEQKIFEANDKGLVVVIVGLMEGVIEKNANNTWCPPVLADSRVYARNVAARFAGSFVIFSPGFDRNAGSSVCAGAGDTTLRIKDIGGVIAVAAPRSLVTNHWASSTSGNEVLGLQDETWLDFQLFQSGQAGYVPNPPNPVAQLATLSCRARQQPLCIWNRSCPFACPYPAEPAPGFPAATKPAINGESIYDGLLSAKHGVTNYHALNARRTGYLSMMSGARGYTYGSEGVFNWGETTTSAPTGWQRRSGRHLQYRGAFFRGITFRSLVTAEASLLLTPQPAEEHKKLVVSRGSAGTYLVAYLPDNSEIKFNFASFPALQVNGRWLNPRTGAYPIATKVVSDPTKPWEITYRRPSEPPTCPSAGPPDPLATCAGEPTTDPCYCVDPAKPERGERDWVLVVP